MAPLEDFLTQEELDVIYDRLDTELANEWFTTEDDIDELDFDSDIFDEIHEDEW
jgi:hypothetical protein